MHNCPRVKQEEGRRGKGRGLSIMYRIHIYSDSFFPTFFPYTDSVIAPSDSDPERYDDYETETESFVGPIR